jgi:GT2 family glycosyltransferase
MEHTATLSPIEVPAVARPQVSIVIVTYGQWPFVRDAIAALVAHTDPTYELIIVDNASPDGTGDELERGVRGARIFHMPTNVGFGNGANFGAGQAVGRYLCFLNSDAFVEPGWLPPLVDALAVPGTGAAIPAVLDMGGTLQEAGSVIGRDGSTLPVGDRGHFDNPAHRFARAVDYGSAVCLLMRRSTFLRAGGFDPRYEVAYYEDVDLALELAQQGLNWRYQPASSVRHVRHASSSHAIATQLMLINRDRFVAKWHHVLDARTPLDWSDRYPHRRAAARDAPAPQRILLVHDRVPRVDRTGADRRAALLATSLAFTWADSRVTLLAVDADAGPDPERYWGPLLAAGVEVVAGVDTAAWLARRRFHYDVAVVSRPSDHERVDHLLDRYQPQATRVYDAEALAFRTFERRAGVTAVRHERWRLLDQAAAVKEIELAAIRRAEAVLCVSDAEAAVVSAMVPGTRPVVVAHAVEPAAAPAGVAGRSQLLFFGGFGGGGKPSPNEDAAVLAAREVLPLLRAIDPDLRLFVVGAEPTPTVRALDGDAVEVVGGVDDPGPWLARSRLHVAPHRFGAGIRVALVESMAAGLPFVTTAVGAEGLGLDPFLAGLLVADDVGDLARLARPLLAHDELWAEVQQRLLALARDQFSPARFLDGLVAAMAEVGVAPPRRDHAW